MQAETIATVDELQRTTAGMTSQMPSERRRLVLYPYIVSRLNAEGSTYRKHPDAKEGHGYNAAVALSTGYSAAFISDLRKEKKGISDDAVFRLARFWKISVAELERLADQWAASRSPEEDTSPAARLNRLVVDEANARRSRGETVTSEQILRALSLAAVGGQISRADVRRAFDMPDRKITPETGIDADMEQEHHAARDRRRSTRKR